MSLNKNERIELKRLKDLSLVRTLTPEQAARLKELSQQAKATPPTSPEQP